MTGTIDFSSQASELLNLVTVNGSYLFRYLANITGIILDGCTNITQTNNSIAGENKNQLVFTNMTKLQNLSIQNCTGITGNVDLTPCTDIRQVDASGVSCNVIIPENAPITKYEVGTPTMVSMINPTSISPNNVVVDSSSSIGSIDLVNIPNNKSFTMFAKIMNLN